MLSLERSCLALAKELIELKYRIRVTKIEFKDGSGRNFIVSSGHNRRQFIRLEGEKVDPISHFDFDENGDLTIV